MRIVVCGVGGAYPGSGLAVGDVACAEVECYGDLGASSPTGFLDMQALGFPVIAGPPPIYNDLPLQVFPVERRVRFVTVDTCTGTDERRSRDRGADRRGGGEHGRRRGRARRVLHGIPVGELRGISNLVTNRDTGAWRLQEAALAAQEALVAWISRR